jgi:CheY-like chemotaxis protein
MARILVMDDQQPVRFMVRRILETDQHTVVEATDGLQALQVLGQTQNCIDLILLDLRMPNLDGYEFLALLRLRPIRPPMVILTALWKPNPTLTDYPINGYLAKPFTRQQLLDVVHRNLSAHAG